MGSRGVDLAVLGEAGGRMVEVVGDFTGDWIGLGLDGFEVLGVIRLTIVSDGCSKVEGPKVSIGVIFIGEFCWLFPKSEKSFSYSTSSELFSRSIVGTAEVDCC